MGLEPLSSIFLSRPADCLRTFMPPSNWKCDTVRILGKFDFGRRVVRYLCPGLLGCRTRHVSFGRMGACTEDYLHRRAPMRSDVHRRNCCSQGIFSLAMVLLAVITLSL